MKMIETQIKVKGYLYVAGCLSISLYLFCSFCGEHVHADSEYIVLA